MSLPFLANASKLDANQVLKGAFDDNSFTLKTQLISNFTPALYDSVQVTYTSATIETYTFFTGGLAGTLVGTLTLTYTDSTKANLSTAVRT